MSKTTLWILILSLALTPAALAATDAEKCQNKKLIALGKRALCYEKERGKKVLGKTPDTAKCEEKFDKQILAADKAAGCRWLVNGDGTATDLNTGLQWEMKTSEPPTPSSIHAAAHMFSWTDWQFPFPDGDAFHFLLGTLNWGESSHGATTTGCFAGKCDWRLPTIEELAELVDTRVPGCGIGSPCTSIPGETEPARYFSSTTDASTPNDVWLVDFADGSVAVFNGTSKASARHVRAVRGGL